jgi:nitroreductase
MNEILKAIRERRSIRAFKAEPVSSEGLEQILDAAIWAPTARNTQAFHITAVQGIPAIAKLDAAVKEASRKPGFDVYKDFVLSPQYTINFGNASLFLIVGCHRSQSACPKEDGSMVLGNILLAAHSLGLGGCWVNQLAAICEEPGFRKVLSSYGFPESHIIVGCAAIGHRLGENPPGPARKGRPYNLS